MAKWARLRIAQPRDDLLLELRGDGVLETVGFDMRFVEVKSEEIDDHALRQPVTPDDAVGRSPPLAGKHQILVRRRLQKVLARHSPQHAADRWQRSAEAFADRQLLEMLREVGQGDPQPLLLELNDR
jgi:hypothetical protein